MDHENPLSIYKSKPNTEPRHHPQAQSSLLRNLPQAHWGKSHHDQWLRLITHKSTADIGRCGPQFKVHLKNVTDNSAMNCVTLTSFFFYQSTLTTTFYNTNTKTSISSNFYFLVSCMDYICNHHWLFQSIEQLLKNY